MHLEQLRQRLQALRAGKLEQVLDHARALQRALPEALRALRARAAAGLYKPLLAAVHESLRVESTCMPGVPDQGSEGNTLFQ